MQDANSIVKTRRATRALLAKAIVVGALFACLAAVMPASALAATAYSGATPASGATIVGLPQYVSVFADADSAILASSKLAIDGIDVTTTVDWVGHWVPDYEPYWVVDDDTAATLSSPTTWLAAGTHTAVATVNTASSGTSTYTWSFTLVYPADQLASFSARQPLTGSTITEFPQVKVTVESSNTLNGADGALYLDGVRLSSSYAAVSTTKTTLVTNATVPMSDGPHTVRATILDSLRIPSEDSWSFNVSVKPTISAPVVSNTPAIEGQSPIRVITADNTPGQLRLVLRLDGVQVFDGMVSQGTFQWDPPGGLPIGSSHVVRADVYDAVGNTQALSWAFTAPSAGASIYQAEKPSSGATVVGSPQYVSVFVDADSAVLSTSTLTIDGAIVNATVDWPGHVEDPTCEAIWVVDDYTAATVSFAAGVLTPGTHTAVATVRTASSGTSTYTWSFTVTYPADQLAKFSARVPSPNTTITAFSQVRATVESSNTINGWYGALYLDGTRLGISYSPLTANKLSLFSYTSPALTDGTHTARATILDSLRIPSEDSWSFNVAVAPTISALEPADGSTVHIPRPVVRVTSTDNSPGPLRLVLRVDGVQKFDGSVAQGAFRWDPTADYANGTQHTVLADVTDAAGNRSTRTWSFTVQAAAPMSTEGDCASCHQAATHPFTNCTGCHQDDPLADPHGPNRFGPVGPCYDCHGSSYGHTISSDCAYCHASSQWLQIPRHDRALVATKHVSSTTGCESCHAASLIDEHAKYPSTSAFKYQCQTCHTSARPEVQLAISGKVTACTSCHTAFDGHMAVHVSTTTPSGSICGGCHESNLVAEHVTKRGFTCATCHDAGAVSLGAVTPSDIASAIANGVTSCEACHKGAPAPEPHGFSVAPVNYATACSKCHLEFAGSHPYHNANSNCGSTCHSGWGAALSANVPGYAASLGGGVKGGFASADSTATSPGLLHIIHSKSRWMGETATPSSSCRSCHAAAACEACHEGTINPAHEGHASTQNPISVRNVSRGVLGGNQADTGGYSPAESSTCGAPACHNIDGVAAGAPGLKDDKVHAASPANDYLANPTIIKSAGWFTAKSSAYTLGQASFSNTKGATLSVPFNGTQIALVADKDPFRGIAEILIDGISEGTVDLYQSTTSNQIAVWRSATLASGDHTITVRVTGDKRPVARATYVCVDQFKIYSKVPGGLAPACTGCH